jgi:hypothetical protein
MKVVLQLLQFLARRWTMQQRRVVDHHDVAAGSTSGRLRWIHRGISGQKRGRRGRACASSCLLEGQQQRSVLRSRSRASAALSRLSSPLVSSTSRRRIEAVAVKGE